MVVGNPAMEGMEAAVTAPEVMVGVEADRALAMACKAEVARVGVVAPGVSARKHVHVDEL